MSDILKATKLDFFLMKPYIKHFCLIIAVPIAYTVLGRSLLSGISFAMCLVAVTAVYPFSVMEKNGMERLYGILPVSYRSLVLGRYCYICILGFAALLFAILVHPAILRAMGMSVPESEIRVAVIFGIIVFCLYIVFQLPAYYKFGTIKGRVFIYIPTVGFFATLYFFPKIDVSGISTIIGNPVMLAAFLLLICIAAYLISIAVSIHIVKNKEV